MNDHSDKPLFTLTIGEFIKLHEKLLFSANQKLQVKSSTENEWLETKQAKQLIGVKSKSKMQKLRDSGAIKFSQHGRIIMYEKKSLLDFLEKNVPKF